MNKCVIIGAGTYGQVYAVYLSTKYEVLGFVDDDESIIGSYVVGHKVLCSVQTLMEGKVVDPSLTSVFVPIGNNMIRSNILHKARVCGFETPSFVHETVILDSTIILGDAVYILPACNIMPFVTVADDVMISMGVNIAHHVQIEKGCFFSQGTNIGASILVKQRAYIGISSTLMTGVKVIGQDSLVGAGAVVIRDVPDNAVMAGVPAKVLKYK